MRGIPVLFLFNLGLARCIEPNYEDFESALEQPQGESVEVDQTDPHSNSVHIAHNIPTGSDVSVRMTNPYNVSGEYHCNRYAGYN